MFGKTQQIQPGQRVIDSMVCKEVLSDVFLVRPVEYGTTTVSKYKFSSIIQNKAWYDIHGHQLQMSFLAKQTWLPESSHDPPPERAIWQRTESSASPSFSNSCNRYTTHDSPSGRTLDRRSLRTCPTKSSGAQVRAGLHRSRLGSHAPSLRVVVLPPGTYLRLAAASALHVALCKVVNK